MKTLIAISLELGEDVEGLADKVLEVINIIKPKELPYFADEVRIVTPDFYDEVVSYMDGKRNES